MPSNQSTIEEGSSRIESLLVGLSAGQEQILSQLGSVSTDIGLLKFQMNESRENAKERYADLRARIDLNNDKLGVIMRELNQIDRDIRNPKFTVADTR